MIIISKICNDNLIKIKFRVHQFQNIFYHIIVFKCKEPIFFFGLWFMCKFKGKIKFNIFNYKIFINNKSEYICANCNNRKEFTTNIFIKR